jgi:tetrahydromethanopterin S-methyltransferase subunit F
VSTDRAVGLAIGVLLVLILTFVLLRVAGLR